MGSVMNMGQYGIVQDLPIEEYGEEIMCSGWNPAVELVTLLPVAEPARSRRNLTAHLAAMEAEPFPAELYTFLH